MSQISCLSQFDAEIVESDFWGDKLFMNLALRQQSVFASESTSFIWVSPV